MENEATSGFTDEQLQQIREVAQQVTDTVGNDFAARMDTLSAQVNETVSQGVPSALASALDSRSGVQSVALVGDQWDSISGYVVLSNDSLRLQNSIALFQVLLVAALIGVLFFELFSKGFRRG